MNCAKLTNFAAEIQQITSDMTRKLTLIALLVAVMLTYASAQQRAARNTALLSAKNLMVTTTSGSVYYYLVSSNDIPVMYLSKDTIRIGQDKFAKSKIKSMRFHAMPRFIMDEDSLTFNKSIALDHALVALRRTLVISKCNSIVLPIELTGSQVLDIFGSEAQLASPSGISDDDLTAVEFKTIDLNTDNVVMKPNYHYLIRPSREPDVLSTRWLSGFASERISGPIYLMPNISMKVSQSPRLQSFYSNDKTTKVRFRGSYYLLDGSTTSNKKVQPGAYTLDAEDGHFVLNEDSVAVKAFQSWVLDLSEDPKNLKFYIDGVELTDGISNISIDRSKTYGHTYDMSGRMVPEPSKKGIYIINGKKIAIK